jgi:hypothetical protein
MALKRKGNLGWVLQVGSRLPVEDEYGLHYAEETWSGRRDQLELFQITHAPGTAHASFPYMRVGKIDEPVYRFAEMAECRVRYWGHPNAGGIIIPGDARVGEVQTLRKTQTVSGQWRQDGYRVLAYVLQTHVGPWEYYANINNDRWLDAQETSEFFTPSIVIRYCRPAEVLTPQFQLVAQARIGNNPPSQISKRRTISNGDWQYDQLPNVEGGAPYTWGGWYSLNAAHFRSSDNAPIVPTLTAVSVLSREMERSGWHQCEEAWEWVINTGSGVS